MYHSKVAKLEVVKYRFAHVEGQPKIIIEMVKLLDENDKYIKFEKMENVESMLAEYPVTFKKL